MSFSSDEAKVNAPPKRSYSCTKSRLLNIRHDWKISNFVLYRDHRILRSPTFSAEGHDEVKWSISLYPNGNDEYYSCKGFVSLYVRLDYCDRRYVQAKGKLSLVDAEGKDIIKKSLEPTKFKMGQGWGFGKVIKQDHLIDHLSDLSNTELTLHCELTVVV